VLAIMIDTSSAAVTAAVVNFGADDEATADGQASTPVVLAARSTVDARAHAELLAPSIQECLKQAGITPADVAAIVAGVGPGPFTGLRVGLVTAAALGDALGVPTYGVCSLDAIAADLALDHTAPGAAGDTGNGGVEQGAATVLVAGDARRREVYWARYAEAVVAPADVSRVAGAGRPTEVSRLAGPDVARPGEIDLTGVGAVAGAGARLYADVFGLTRLEPDYPTPRGLARLAADRVRARALSEPLRPLYLRRPDAVAPASYKAVTPQAQAHE
jgi:tRNA threonylcarbamoyl adenosine modification protein YeaZ